MSDRAHPDEITEKLSVLDEAHLASRATTWSWTR